MAINDETTQSERPDLAGEMEKAAASHEKNQDHRIANLEHSVTQLSMGIAEMRAKLLHLDPRNSPMNSSYSGSTLFTPPPGYSPYAIGPQNAGIPRHLYSFYNKAPEWMHPEKFGVPFKTPEKYFLEKLRDRKQELVNGLASLVQSALWGRCSELRVPAESVESFSVATEDTVFSFSKVATKDSEGWTVGVVQASGVTNEVITHLNLAPYMMFKYI